jgi:hypothetical protein
VSDDCIELLEELSLLVTKLSVFAFSSFEKATQIISVWRNLLMSGDDIDLLFDSITHDQLKATQWERRQTIHIGKKTKSFNVKPIPQDHQLIPIYQNDEKESVVNAIPFSISDSTIRTTNNTVTTPLCRLTSTISPTPNYPQFSHSHQKNFQNKSKTSPDHHEKIIQNPHTHREETHKHDNPKISKKKDESILCPSHIPNSSNLQTHKMNHKYHQISLGKLYMGQSEDTHHFTSKRKNSPLTLPVHQNSLVLMEQNDISTSPKPHWNIESKMLSEKIPSVEMIVLTEENLGGISQHRFQNRKTMLTEPKVQDKLPFLKRPRLPKVGSLPHLSPHYDRRDEKHTTTSNEKLKNAQHPRSGGKINRREFLKSHESIQQPQSQLNEYSEFIQGVSRSESFILEKKDLQQRAKQTSSPKKGKLENIGLLKESEENDGRNHQPSSMHTHQNSGKISPFRTICRLPLSLLMSAQNAPQRSSPTHLMGEPTGVTTRNKQNSYVNEEHIFSFQSQEMSLIRTPPLGFTDASLVQHSLGKQHWIADNIFSPHTLSSTRTINFLLF